MPGDARLVIDGAKMEEMLRGADGPVVRHLIRVGDAIIGAARLQLQPHKKTGRLADSIVKRWYETEAGITMSIEAGAGLNPSYAYWVHEGNGPPGGRIYPKNARALAFVTSGDRPSSGAGWAAARAGGTAVVVRSVRTSKPIRYLSDNLGLVNTVP